MTIWLLLSGILSLDLLLAIMTLQKFTGKEIRNGILGSFNIFDKVTDKVGGITCKEKNYRTVRDGGNPTKMAIATNTMQVMNIKLKLLVIESKIEYLQ